METYKKLEEWIKSMGYDGSIPSSLEQLCNPSTEFIWQQIIDKVKTKERVEFIRKNVIINRLKEQDTSFSAYSVDSIIKLPMDEIEIWNKKESVYNKIIELEKLLQSEENKIKELHLQNKTDYIILQGLRKRNEEIKTKTFLLGEKFKNFHAVNTKVAEILSLIKRLTPIESDDFSNRIEVTRTLQECANQLKNYIEKKSILKASDAIKTCSFANKSNFLKPMTMRSLNAKNDLFYSSFSTPRANSITSIYSAKKGSSLMLSVHSAHKWNSENILNDDIFSLPNEGNLASNIDNLLTNNNRFNVYNTLQGMDKTYLKQLKELILKYHEFLGTSTVSSNKELHLAKLSSKYIDYELKCVRLNLISKKLNEKIEQMQNQHFHFLANSYQEYNNSPILQDNLIMQQKDAGLSEAIIIAEKQNYDLEQIMESNEDVVLVQQKLITVNNTINESVENLQNQIVIFNEIFTKMVKTKNEICNLAKQQKQFTRDLNWIEPLIFSVNSSEINVFSEFPLIYNRHSAHNKSNFFDQEINMFHLETINSIFNNAKILALTLDFPYSPPEYFIMKLIQEKNMHKLYSMDLKTNSNPICMQYCDFEKLRNGKKYLNDMTEKFNKIIFNETTKKTLTFSNFMELTMNLWMQMPFKNYISPNEKLAGQSFLYYEKQFVEFYKKFKLKQET